MSITCISLSCDSFDIPVITLYPFANAAFSIPLKTFAKNGFKIFGMMTPIVLVR